MSTAEFYFREAAESETTVTSEEKDIIPRDIHFDISGNAKRHWLQGDLFKTILIDNLSVFLPEGERFFISSLKHYAPQITDKALAAETRDFIIQEAFHTREHEDYNRAMVSVGYDVEDMQKPIRYGLGTVTDPLVALAFTCAIEHMTTTFASIMLSNPKIFEGAAPAYHRIWMWHALEELEHKAVAIDVLKAVTPNLSSWKRYLLRVMAMSGALIPFFLIFLRNVPVYAHADGVKTGPRFWLRFFWVVWIAPGFLGRAIIPLLRYYSPNFDPRARDDRELVRKGRQWLARDLAQSI